MLRMTKLVLIASAALVAAGTASAAFAQGDPAKKSGTEQWGYTVKDGQKIPVGTRVNNPDGTWREEIKKGDCVTVKERTASGEIRKTDSCKPAA